MKGKIERVFWNGGEKVKRDSEMKSIKKRKKS